MTQIYLALCVYEARIIYLLLAVGEVSRLLGVIVVVICDVVAVLLFDCDGVAAHYIFDVIFKLGEHVVDGQSCGNEAVGAVVVFGNAAVIGIAAVVLIESLIPVRLSEVIFKEEIISARAAVIVEAGLVCVERIICRAVEPCGALVGGDYIVEDVLSCEVVLRRGVGSIDVDILCGAEGQKNVIYIAVGAAVCALG